MSVSVTWADPAREAACLAWLRRLDPALGLLPDSLRAASADASFRRYLRVDGAAGSLIVMDAPPDKENCAPFVQVQALMQQAGLNVPRILAFDATHGFMLLSDLGPHTLMQALDPQAPQDAFRWYQQATDLLIDWQKASRPGVLPPYDEALLRRELALFPDWYLAQHRKVTLTDAQQQTLAQSFAAIVANNLAAPQVFVHRDFMPRNLMQPVTPDAPLGVLDFQDAVYGPITYDIASLMRDAFLSWDEDFVIDITVRYWEKARKAGIPVRADFAEFHRDYEWMGVQRHVKVLGIFSRLWHRDGKDGYLRDMPLVSKYLRAACARYRHLAPLLRLLDRIEDRPPQAGYTF